MSTQRKPRTLPVGLPLVLFASCNGILGIGEPKDPPDERGGRGGNAGSQPEQGGEGGDGTGASGGSRVGGASGTGALGGSTTGDSGRGSGGEAAGDGGSGGEDAGQGGAGGEDTSDGGAGAAGNGNGAVGGAGAGSGGVGGAGAGSSGAGGAAGNGSTGCDPEAPFKTPVPLLIYNGQIPRTSSARLTDDELTMVFMDAGNHDIWIANRASTSEDFADARKLIEVGTDDYEDWVPTLTGDGLTLFFSRVTPARYEIFVATRERRTDFFSGASRVPSLDNTGAPYVTPNGQAIYLGLSNGIFGSIFHAERVQGSFVFGPRSEHQGLSAGGYATYPVVSADELTIYFLSNRTGGPGLFDIYRARRSNRSNAFGQPKLVNELNTGDDDVPGWISPDQCTIYLHRFNGAEKIFAAKRTP